MARLSWQKWQHYVAVQVKILLRLRGDPRAIARGVGMGIAMNFIPTIGLGLPVVYGAAALARGHKMAAMISTMTIKLIFPILYILNYMMGELLLNQHFIITFDWQLALRAGASFFLGTVVNFFLSYLLSYYITLKMIYRYRQRR